MTDGKRIEIPDNISREAEKHISLSGFASVSDAARSLLRRFIEEAEKKKEGPPKSERLCVNTIKSLFPLWMRNFKRNLDDIEKGRDITQLADKFKDRKSSIVVGAGPSVHKYGHLNMLAKSGYEGVIIATDRILIPCLKEGVIPDIVMSLDGDFEVSEFFKHDLVKKHAKDMDVLFSTVVDNTTVKMWPRKDNIYFFNPHIDTMEEDMSISKAMLLMTGKAVTHTAGNVGSGSWFLSILLNKNPIGFIGMDLSYPDTDDIEKIPSFGIYDKMHNGDPEKIIKCFRRYHNPFFKNDTIIDYIMQTYWEVFSTWIPAIYEAHGNMTINCTGGGAIHKDNVLPGNEPLKGLECMEFKDFLKKYRK